MSLYRQQDAQHSMQRPHPSSRGSVRDARLGHDEGSLHSGDDEAAEEIAFLRDTVRRLSHELGVYQAKYGDLTESARDAYGDGLPFEAQGEQAPAWLVNFHKINPLLKQYDHQLRTSHARLQEADQEMKAIRHRVEALIEENEEQAAALAQVPKEDWDDLREHVALLSEENKMLLQKQEAAVASQAKMQKELDRATQRAQQLDQQLARCQADKQGEGTEMAQAQQQIGDLQRQVAAAHEQARSLRDENTALMDGNRRLQQQQQQTSQSVREQVAPAPLTMATEHSYVQLRQESAQLRAQLQQADRDRHFLETKLQAAQAYRNQATTHLESVVQAAEATKRKLRQELYRRDAHLQRLSAEIRASQEETLMMRERLFDNAGDYGPDHNPPVFMSSVAWEPTLIGDPLPR